VGLFVAWWVVKIGVVDAEVDDNPFLAAQVAPNHPRVRISLAMVYFLIQGGRVPDESRRAALDAMRQAPLADEPFLLAAVDALARGDNRGGERLLEEARRRNPRLRLARLLLLDRYLRERRIDEAVLEMKALDNLVEGVSGVLMPALAHMAQDPETAQQMVPLLRAQPALQEAVLESLATSGASGAVLLNVAGPAVRSRHSEPWKAMALSHLVSQHEFDKAWDLWKNFTGYQGDTKGIYDPGFAGLPGPPPFNWDLTTHGPGAADLSRNHTLQVNYYGRDNGDLASQLLILRPGRYRFSFRASGDASGEGSRLVWTFACNPANSQILQMSITGVASAPKRFTASLEVPASGCTTQWLRLDGISGDVESAQEVAISDLSLKPENGS
jgi:hypothetical protein